MPGIVTYSVLLLLPTCEAYWQGGWTFAGKARCELFAYSACMGEHSFLGENENENFQKAIVKEQIFFH